MHKTVFFFRFYDIPFHFHKVKSEFKPQIKLFYALFSQNLRFVDLHPGLVLVNSQLDAQIFLVFLFLFSTHFGQPYANHRDNYYISSTPDLCHSVYMTVWYAGTYAPAYQTVMYTE